ncbi:enoyl-CoA-hydratase DpgB [Streptomyces sp. NPDC058307]|uniref:enoyl-CoA-hydratase DpgB n=1 Tax=Streptomyces sp. NPDC058307 TaxID=3346439 RepID=UPI0036E7424A
MNDQLRLRIDGSRPLSAETVAAVGAVCDAAEDGRARGPVVLELTGSPAGPGWTDGLTVGLVSKWERALRRLERLPAVTVSIADGACGGAALDALLATDLRVATRSLHLRLPALDGTTWPGMALHRLAQQAPGIASIRRATLFGTPIDASEALTLHLIDEVADDVTGAAAAAAGLAAGVNGPEMAIRRQLVLDAHAVPFEEALGAHLAACDRALRRTAAEAAA